MKSMEEIKNDDGNPQSEPEASEVISGEEMNPEVTTTEVESSVDEVKATPENSEELLAEAETADEDSEDAVDESTDGDLIPNESDKSEDVTSGENDNVATEEETENLDDEILVVEEEKLEVDAVEESVDEPTAEKQEAALEIVDEHDEPSQTVEGIAVKSEEAADDRNWFVVHCYSGYENKVRHNLEQRIETMGMKDKIFDVVVPTEEEIEVKDGKRKTVERRVFPGYILVQMILDEDSWYVVRNTPGVTGFVGMGNEPTPLRPEEVAKIVKRMEAEAPRIKLAYSIGQKVRIIDGPFNDFIGTVADIDMERAIVRVMVSFFGRETPVELDFLQVDKA